MSALLLLAQLVATILHIALVLALAPLLAGVVATWRARLLGRVGPPIWQPYANLRRQLSKIILVPETATAAYHIWPLLALSAFITVATLVPGFCTGMVTAGLSDFITVIGLLALARAAILMAALETGFGFSGAAAAREILFSLFAEATMLVIVLSFVQIAHSPSLDGISVALRAQPLGISVSLGFALAATLAVALTETGRIPVDNPSGHLELSMVHEALHLEYSGGLL
ncbi:MAG: NADH-quinone oxidoreductase subunit H, partial [Acidocella sp.]|nr:NADH-quinone oxidoreductase subunit H [Acidocella sp.]